MVIVDDLEILDENFDDDDDDNLTIEKLHIELIDEMVLVV